MTAATYVDDDGNVVVEAGPSGASLPDSLLPARLARLPRHRGLAVQWIAGWSGEFPLAVRYDEMAGAWALLNDGPDHAGVPLTGKGFGCQTTRGRYSALFGLCRGCGLPITGSSWSAIDHDYQRGQYDGAPPITMWEPGCCWTCLGYAARFCPKIVRLRNGDGSLIQIHCAIPYARLLCFQQPPEANGQGDDLEAECVRRGGVVASPWLILTEWTEWNAAEALEHTSEPRELDRTGRYTPSLPEPFSDDELEGINVEGGGPANVGLHDLRFPGHYLFWPEWRGWRANTGLSKLRPIAVAQSIRERNDDDS